MEELAAKIADLLKDLPWPEAERVLALASHNVKVREQPLATTAEEPAPREAGRSPFGRNPPANPHVADLTGKSGDYLGEN